MKAFYSSLSGRFVSRLFVVFTALCALSWLPGSDATAQQASARVSLATRTAATLANAEDAGPVPAAQSMTLVLTLSRTAAKQAALTQFLSDVQTSTSPGYHQWMTPQQFAASFGADATQAAAAEAWARAQGLTATLAPSGQRLLVSGTAGQVETAFAVSVHTYQTAGAAYYAANAQPSLPENVASLFTAVDGLDNLPGATVAATYLGAQGQVRAAALRFTALAGVVDQNLTPMLTLNTSLASAAASPAEVAEYQELFKQAAAQGITVLATRGAAAGAFPAAFAEVTEVALAGDPAETLAPGIARPDWQVAPGLPADALRHAPDLQATSVAALAQTLTGIAGAGRLGSVNAVLYTLGPLPDVYTQPDGAAAGTWEPSTGLGLVNLPALAKAFPRGSGQSFTSLAISSYTPQHGQGTSFTSNVTSGTGGVTPTGTVAFIVDGVTYATVALNNGTATYSTNTLPGGQHTVTAQYSGDATYAASSAPTPATIYVSPEPSNLGVQVSGGAVIGTNFTVIVTDSSSSGVGVPTGAVTVTLPVNGAAYTGTLQASGTSTATATISVPPPAVGTVTLSVNCTSSVNFSCSNPYTTTVTVSKATPSLTISYAPNPPVSGQTITLNATVSAVGSAPVPTGNVQFFDNGTTLNAGALNGGTTTTIGTVPTTSTHSITATYQGDANYNTVSTTAGSTTSGAISTSLALSSSASTVVANQNITFTAILTPSSTGSAQPTGTVQFFDNGTQLLGTSSVSQNVATFTTATLSPTVNHSITAVYSGDTIYTGSSSGAVTVNKSALAIGTTLALTASAAAYTPGQPLNLVASITAASNASTGPTGTVQFFDNGAALGSAAVSSGTATLSTTFTSGTQTITATYSGDTNYASSSSGTLALNKSAATTASTTTLTASPATVNIGGSVTLSVLVTPTVNNTAPTGTVQFVGGSATLCSAQLSGSTASCTITEPTAGSFSYTASYQGDTNYSASTSNTVTVNVTNSVSTLSASLSPTTAAGGTIVSVTTVLTSPSGLTPSGQITATVLGVTGAVYSDTLLVTTPSSVTTVIGVPAPAAAGTYNIVVSCAGTNFTCAPVTLSLTSTGSSSTTGKIATTTVLTPSAPTLPANGAETLTATITPASAGTAAPTGTVSFYNGTTLLGSGVVTAAGTVYSASVATVLTAGTANTLTAVYSGDANYATSTSTAVTLGGTGTTTVTPAAIVLTASQTTGLAGSGITLTADVTGLTSAGASPTGTVTFYLVGTTPSAIATVALQPAGTGLSVATYITSGLTAGSSQIYAVYSGDTNFSTAISNTISLGLNSFNVSFVPQSLTLNQGQSGQSTLILGIVNGFSGTVSFGCTPPPNQLMTCSFSQPILTGGGSTVLTIQTTAARAQTVVRAGSALYGGLLGGMVLAALLWWLVPGRARRRLPALLLLALAMGLMANVGCSESGNGIGVASGGTPLGTTIFTITAAGSDGTNTVRQNYSFQVTVQQ